MLAGSEQQRPYDDFSSGRGMQQQEAGVIQGAPKSPGYDEKTTCAGDPPEADREDCTPPSPDSDGRT